MHEFDQNMLSQMMDGEWDELDPSRCAALVCDDPVARSRWARYHMIRDVMNNEPVRIDTDLASRVRATIDAEPAYTNVARLQGVTEPEADTIFPDRSPAGESEQGAASPAKTGQSHSELNGTAQVRPTEGHTVQALTADNRTVPQAISAQPALRTVAGLAVAASMALVTVIGLDRLQLGGDGVVDGSGAAQVTAQSTTPTAIQGSAQSPVQNTAQVAAARAPAFGVNLPDADIGQARSAAQAVPGPVAVTNLPGTVLPQVEYVSNRGSHWVTGNQKRHATTESRLNMFLSQHIENSPTAEHQGMLPYSRLVGYDELPAK